MGAKPVSLRIKSASVNGVLVVTNSLRYIPRQSSKNCDLQFAKSDRFKENDTKVLLLVVV